MKMRPEYSSIGRVSLGLLIGLNSLLSSSAVAGQDDSEQRPATGLVKEVREATAQFRHASAAEAEGWVSADSCVSAPEKGAMGIHFINGELVGDGELDPRRPEALIYEAKNNQLQLIGVEFITIAEEWHAANGPATPVLMGQLLHFVGSPNRYGLPAFYELHVWAWKNNPSGMFVDWNPKVSCEEYTRQTGNAPT